MVLVPPLLLFARRMGPFAGLIAGLEAHGVRSLLAEEPAVARELVHAHGVRRVVVDLAPPLEQYHLFLTWISLCRPLPSVLLLCARYEETVAAGMKPRRKAWAGIRPSRMADLLAFAQRDPLVNGPFMPLSRLSWGSGYG